MKEWFEGKTVAVVGNAMSLFDKSYGVEIDSHDVVVRVNKAAMLYTRQEVSKSHGTKTHVWVFWNTSEYKSFFTKIPKHVKKMHAGHQGRIHSNISAVDFVYPDSLYKELKKHAGKHNNPTTGLITLDYIKTCKPKHVDVYGFDWKESPTFTDPDMKREKACPHDYPKEKEYCMKTFFSREDFVLKN
jgi:hypothetical protein